MPSTWKGPAALDKLKELLDGRAGLVRADGERVQVATTPRGDEMEDEAIVFFGILGEQRFGPVGNKARDDTFTLVGAVWVQKRGTGEADGKAARDRAAALLAEIENTLRGDPSLGNVVRKAEVDRYKLDAGNNNLGSWCQIDVDIRCEARI